MAYTFEPRQVEVGGETKWQMFFKDTDDPKRTFPVGDPHPSVMVARKDPLASQWMREIDAKGEVALARLEEALEKVIG